MNESIIRRFARYHGVDIGDQVPFAWINTIAAQVSKLRSDIERRDAIVQSIAHIEDAEMLLARVESFSVPLLATSQEAKELREFYAFDAARLFAMAGIDPELWARVKE